MTTPALPAVEVIPPQTGVPDVKPGYATTEFWFTVIFAFLSLLTGLNVIGPDWTQAHKQLLDSLAITAATLAPGIYAIARAITKHGHTAAVATVLAAQVHALADHGVLPVIPGRTAPLTTSTPPPTPAASDAGAGVIELLVLIAALILVAIGVILVIVAAVGTPHVLSVPGVVMIVVGVVLAILGRSLGGGRPLTL